MPAHFTRDQGQRTNDQTSELKHLQSVVTRVDGDDAVVLVYRDTPWIGKFTRMTPGCAPGFKSLSSVFVDHLDAIVPELTDDEVAFVVLGKAIGEAELAQLGAGFAHVANELAFGGEDGDAVIARVGDVDEARILLPTVHCRLPTGSVVDDHGLGAGEFAVAVSDLAKLEELFEILVEHLDAVVAAVLADVDAAVVEGDVGGKLELTVAVAFGAERLEDLAVERVDDDAVVMCVGDPEITVRPDFHADRLAVLPFGHLPFGEALAIAVEPLHVGDAVDDEECVGGGFVGDGARVDDFGGAGAGFAPDGLGLGTVAAAGEDEEKKNREPSGTA